MSLRSLVLRQVDKAFNAIGDLKISVTLIKKSSGQFNFATQDSAITTDSTTVIPGIVKRKLKRIASPKDSNNSQHVDVVFKTADIGDPSLYFEAVIEGVKWKVTPPYDANPFVTTVSLVREI